MSFRFTIGKKIGSGFGVLLLFTFVVFALTYNTLRESRKINDDIIEKYNPSVQALEDLNLLIVRSKMLILNWISVQITDDPDKEKLRVLINEEYPVKRETTKKLAVNWSPDEQEQVEEIFEKIESLFIMHEDIMSQLNSFESYEDPMVVFMLEPMVENGEVDEETTKILNRLGELIESHQKSTRKVSERMIGSFDDLEFVVKVLGLALLIGGLLIAVFTVRSIVKPVQELKRLLFLLGKGVIPKEKINNTNDEIGDMSLAMNDLVDGFKRTTDFAKEVGSGNFESEYKPLSKNDTLGYALLTMREDLHESERKLEKKVKERTEEVVLQKEEIELQNKEITASIRYAKRIQESILPDQSMVNVTLKDHFILYRPKDIVSGDFYWIGQQGGKALFAAVDCTGHGVPGAFMSIIGNALLKEAIVEHQNSEPATILTELNKLAGETINQTFEESTVKDGMDIALCSLDFQTLELQYSGAYNPLYIVRKRVKKQLSENTNKLIERENVELRENAFDHDLLEIKANKFPIGVFIGEEIKAFSNNKIKLEKGDSIYIFSDGFVDQFGGPRGRKFMARRFRPLLLKIQHLTMARQKEFLNKIIVDWMKNPKNSTETYEQIDDILVIGVRVP